MRRLLMIAAAAMIALIGLSANQCSGGKEDKATTEAPAAAPDDSGKMGSDSDNMGSDTDNMSGEAPAAKPDDSGNMGSDSDNMSGEAPAQ